MSHLLSYSLSDLREILNGKRAVSITNLRLIALDGIRHHIALRERAKVNCVKDITALVESGVATDEPDLTEKLQTAITNGGVDLDEIEIYLTHG